MVLPTHLQYKCFYNAIRAHSACATRDPMYVYVVSSFPPLSKTNILIINLQIFVEHSINPAEGIILPLTAFLRPHPRQMVGPITSATSAILFPSFFWCIYCHIFVPFSQILRTRLAARKTTKKDRLGFSKWSETMSTDAWSRVTTFRAVTPPGEDHEVVPPQLVLILLHIPTAFSSVASSSICGVCYLCP